MKIVTLNNSSAIIVSVPRNSAVAFPIGTSIDFIQLGTGQVTFAPVNLTPVTVNASPTTKLRTQYSVGSCLKIATDDWILMGDLAAS